MTEIREEIQRLSVLIENKMRQTKMSLRDFAEKCNLSHSYVRNIRKGFDPRTGKQIRPTVETLEKLAGGLGLTLNELLRQTGFTITADSDSRLETANPPMIYENNPKDLLKFLEQSEVMFDGMPLTENDKAKVKAALEVVFWDAKQKNKQTNSH